QLRADAAAKEEIRRTEQQDDQREEHDGDGLQETLALLAPTRSSDAQPPRHERGSDACVPRSASSGQARRVCCSRTSSICAESNLSSSSREAGPRSSRRCGPASWSRAPWTCSWKWASAIVCSAKEWCTKGSTSASLARATGSI